MPTLEAAKAQLDRIIEISRTDLYKPIQVAEVLHRSRVEQDIDVEALETYRKVSKKWRDLVTIRLLSKFSTSSARYQDNVWDDNAMPPHLLAILDRENKATSGAVERYIYFRFIDRQSMVAALIEKIEVATPEIFQLEELLSLFRNQSGTRRSVDKAYEIITYSLFETVVCGLEAEVTVNVPIQNRDLLEEFADLAKVLLNVEVTQMQWTEAAHIYRVGVTNAADRGLDMWANFGPAIQVKHLELDDKLAADIVDQVESDYIVIVCRDADAPIIQTVLRQIGWGKRIRGIVKESDLICWYDRCLRGNFAARLAQPLMQRLAESFKTEFPQAAEVIEFCEERGYVALQPPLLWQTQ